MRSPAKVGKRALLIEGNYRVFGQIVYQLDFIFFLILFHKLQRFGTGKLEPFDRSVRFDNFKHFDFDFSKIVLRNGGIEIDIVIKTVFNYGAYGKATSGINVFNSLRKYVRTGMAVNVQPFFIFKRYDFKTVAIFQCTA